MNCPQTQKLLSAHHDGELDAANTLLVDEHLAECPQCGAALHSLATLRTVLKNDALRFSTPAELRSAIRTAALQAASAERVATFLPARSWQSHFGWVAAAAIAVAAFLFFESGRSPREPDPLLAELTANHVRSLMASHLTDVASTDQHTVKPWFDGKLDFAPPVRDLREVGFPLLGGRLDFLAGRPAAALIYGRQKHFVNLFIWPAKTTAATTLQTSQLSGYNVMQWSDGKMNYGAVSDLNETELREFASDWARK